MLDELERRRLHSETWVGEDAGWIDFSQGTTSQ